MPNAAIAQLSQQLTITETIASAAGDITAGNGNVIHSGFNLSLTLNSTTTPPVQQCACGKQVLTAGAATIDLTAVPGTNGGNVNFTGQKVVAILVSAPAANVNPITFKFGAVNPYAFAGAAGQITVYPGTSHLLYLAASAPAVAAGAKNIDLVGTGSADFLNYEFLGG